MNDKCTFCGAPATHGRYCDVASEYSDFACGERWSAKDGWHHRCEKLAKDKFDYEHGRTEITPAAANKYATEHNMIIVSQMVYDELIQKTEELYEMKQAGKQTPNMHDLRVAAERDMVVITKDEYNKLQVENKNLRDEVAYWKLYLEGEKAGRDFAHVSSASNYADAEQHRALMTIIGKGHLVKLLNRRDGVQVQIDFHDTLYDKTTTDLREVADDLLIMCGDKAAK